MQPTAAQLKVIFENKAAVARELKRYVKPIAEFAKDAGLAEFKQEEEHVILEKHFFGHDRGLLPIIEKLIELNGFLLSYEKPEHLGAVFVKYWDKIIELVRDEQDFLINYFRKTLSDVINHRGFKAYWDKSFSSYENLLRILRLDLSYFSLALQIQTKTTVHWIVNLIHDGKIDEVLEFVESHQGQKILSDDEIDFFKRYIGSIKVGDFEKAKKILKEGKELLEEDEIELMWYSLNQKLIPIIHVLILRPLNSLPDNAIDIVSAYHEERRDALDIGKSEQCDIIIVDSPVNDDVQAEIMFARNKNKFVIITSKNITLKINNNIIEKKYAFLEDGYTININGYEFSVNIKTTDKVSISPEDYNRLFENKILRLKREEVTTIQLAKALAKEAEQWDLIKKELPEIKIPIPIDKMPRQIEGAIEEIEEVAPEVGKVKKLKFKGIRINLRQQRKAKEGYKDRREALQKGLRILKNSISLRKKLDEILSSRISQRLQLESKNLQELIEKLEAKKIEFPDFTQQLERLRSEVNGLINQIQEAISKIRIMSRQTANRLLSSASEGRKHIEWFLENIGKPRISRRQLLRGLGTAAIIAAVGGSEALLTRKKPEVKTSVKIIKPNPSSSYIIGKSIDYLEAEVDDPKKEEFTDFSWYIRQENTEWVKIHDQRTGRSEEIPHKFFPGSVELAVVTSDKKGFKKQTKINIELIVGLNPSALGTSVYDFYRLVYSDFDDTWDPLAYEKLPRKTEEEIKRGIQIRDELQAKYDAYFSKANISKTPVNNWYFILGGKDRVRRESFIPKVREGVETHEALDIFAQEGSQVYSPFNGIIVTSGDFWKGGYNKDLVYYGGGLTPKAGNAIVIYNPDEHGYMWIAHFQEGLLVKTGDIVRNGQILGKVGHSGSASKTGHGNHVHVAYKLESKKSGLAYKTLAAINFYDYIYKAEKKQVAGN